jgi:nucleoside triphosphate diphosphatase
LSSAEALADLEQLALRLRRDCPWDREQTAQTIVPHTVEEAYEVADAALADEPEKLVDELGDLLYQVFFLALLLEERGEGNLEAAARAIHDKLVRRHPHVFGDVEAETAARVRENWERIKVREDDALFAGIARSLPALVFARKVQQRAAGIGFEYPDAEGAIGDLEEEVRELRAAGQERALDELGDVLFAAVNTARKLSVDPELALRQATLRFVERVEAAERLAAVDGTDFASLPLDEQDRYFDRAKESL